MADLVTATSTSQVLSMKNPWEDHDVKTKLNRLKKRVTVDITADKGQMA